MKDKILGVVSVVIQVVIIIYAVFITTMMLCTNDHGYTEIGNKTYVVIDDSSIKQLSGYERNDILLIEKVPYEQIKEGDEVFYYDAYRERYVVRRGIVKSLDGDNEDAIFYLEGGASIHDSQILGIDTGKVVHGFGGVYNVLKSLIGFLLFVITPLLMLFVYQIYRTIIIFKENQEFEREYELGIKRNNPNEVERVKEEEPVREKDLEEEITRED